MPCGECKWWDRFGGDEVNECEFIIKNFPKWFVNSLDREHVYPVRQTYRWDGTDCPQFTPRAQEAK